MSETRAEHDLELESLGLMHRHDLHRVAVPRGSLGVVRRGGEQAFERAGEVGE